MERRDAKGKAHILDPSEVDEKDEISGDEQLMLVWCETCKKYEWHWMEIDSAGRRRRLGRT